MVRSTPRSPRASRRHTSARSPFRQDGKILVGGTLPAIPGLATTEFVRLNSNGSTDLAFNPRVAGSVHDVIVLPDGDILVAGQISAVNGATPQTPFGNLFRLNADGTRDFSLQAVVREQGFDFVRSVAIQPDGRIVVGGSLALTVNGVQSRKYLARLNADGSLNTDFPSASPFGGVQAIAVRPDGKILLGGTFDSLFDTPRQSHRGIVQLNADGSLDTGFTPNFNGGTNVEAFALQADGRVWVGGIFSTVDGRDAPAYCAADADWVARRQLRSISHRPGWSPRRRAPAGWQADHRRELLRSRHRACRHRQIAPGDLVASSPRPDGSAVRRSDERRNVSVADRGTGRAADTKRRLPA